MPIVRLSSKSVSVAVLLTLAAASQAQFVVTERNSFMTVSYQFGGGLETFPGSNSIGSSELNSEFDLNLSGNENGSGFTEFGMWEAGIAYNLDNSYNPFEGGWTGVGRISLSTFANGDGFSTLEAIDPGNELIVRFDVIGPIQYSVLGTATADGTFAIQKSGALGWETIYSSNGPNGLFQTGGILGVGDYRIVSAGHATSTGTMMQDSAWGYSFSAQPVPEPATMAMFSLGGLAFLRRRKR